MIRAIIFDFFGVIYSEATVLVESISLTNDSKQKTEKSRDLCHQDQKSTAINMCWQHQIIKMPGISRIERGREPAKTQRMNWELLDYAKALKKNYKMGILSNATQDFIGKNFDDKRLLEDYFDAVVVSGEVGIFKPDERIYREILKRLDVAPEETVYIDDNKLYCQAAEKIGMKSIWYKKLEQFQQELQEFLIQK